MSAMCLIVVLDGPHFDWLHSLVRVPWCVLVVFGGPHSIIRQVRIWGKEGGNVLKGKVSEE